MLPASSSRTLSSSDLLGHFSLLFTSVPFARSFAFSLRSFVITMFHAILMLSIEDRLHCFMRKTHPKFANPFELSRLHNVKTFSPDICIYSRLLRRTQSSRPHATGNLSKTPTFRIRYYMPIAKTKRSESRDRSRHRHRRQAGVSPAQ